MEPWLCRARRKLVSGTLAAFVPFVLATLSPSSHAGASAGKTDELLVVDCLLPGQIRRLGRMTTYVTRRRPTQTTARDCQIRGGEYISHDPASYSGAFRHWLPLAKQGDLEAQTIVGEMFEKGLGRDPDYEAAAAWYSKAANAGDTQAQVNLAHLYEQGLGVEKDAAKASYWYRKASGLEVALDPQTLNEDSRQRDALQDELTQNKRDSERLRDELRRLRNELDRTRRDLEKRERDAKAREKRLQQQRDQSRNAVDFAAVEEALRDNQAKLTQQESTISRLQSEIQRLENESRKKEKKISQMEEANRRVVVAGPSIHIIEPPLIATRGIELVRVTKVPSKIRKPTVVGRVTAPAGLATLLVNHHERSFDNKGLFKTVVPMTESRAKVEVAAIDKLGKRASISFTIEAKDEPPKPVRPVLAPGVFGKYYALVIGNDQYRHLARLSTARNDARAVAKVLKQKYGFKVTLLENASRRDVLSALADLYSNLTSEDNLLLYYAGHGKLDRVNVRGHWLPVDAEPEIKANWISNVDVTDYLRIIRAKQILVVADSCYAGALTRSAVPVGEGAMTKAERIHWLKTMAKKRSRTVLTSGGLEPVLDVGGGNHSVFAKAFLEVLRSNASVMEGRKLYLEVSARVTRRASEIANFEQVPEYAPIQHTGHETGDFFLVPARS